MAIVQANTTSKAKLVYQIDGDGPDPINKTKTLSNIVSGVNNTNLYNGLTALAQMINANDAGVTVRKIDEYDLIDDSGI